MTEKERRERAVRENIRRELTNLERDTGFRVSKDLVEAGDSMRLADSLLNCATREPMFEKALRIFDTALKIGKLSSQKIT